jgi:hypothetical protein
MSDSINGTFLRIFVEHVGENKHFCALEFYLRHRLHMQMFNPLKTESESYVTTDSQSASLSWNKAPIGGLRPDINYCLTITVLFLWAPSLTRGRVWLLYMLLALASAVLLGSEALWSRDHILLSQI